MFDIQGPGLKVKVTVAIFRKNFVYALVPRFIPFIYSNFYVADVCMTVPSDKLICPPTGFVILHFEVQ